MSRLLLTLILTLLSTIVTAEKLFIIVNSENSLSQISKEDLKDIYLGNTHELPGGEVLHPIDHPNHSSAKKAFHRQVTNRTLDQLSAHWARLVFTGRGYPISQANNEKAVVQYVTREKNGIGYTSYPPQSDSIKIILVLE